jgi:hypothetical protein
MDEMWINDFEILVSYAFCGVRSNPDPTSYSSCPVRMQLFIAGLLSRNDPVDQNFLSSWMPLVLGTVLPGNLRRIILRHFLAKPCFTHDSYSKTRCWTLYRTISGSQVSSGSIVSDYGLDNRAIGIQSPAEAKEFSSVLLCPDRLWDPPTLLSNGYRGSFPRGVTLHPI